MLYPCDLVRMRDLRREMDSSDDFQNRDCGCRSTAWPVLMLGRWGSIYGVPEYFHFRYRHKSIVLLGATHIWYLPDTCFFHIFAVSYLACETGLLSAGSGYFRVICRRFCGIAFCFVDHVKNPAAEEVGIDNEHVKSKKKHIQYPDKRYGPGDYNCDGDCNTASCPG